MDPLNRNTWNCGNHLRQDKEYFYVQLVYAKNDLKCEKNMGFKGFGVYEAFDLRMTKILVYHPINSLSRNHIKCEMLKYSIKKFE